MNPIQATFSGINLNDAIKKFNATESGAIKADAPEATSDDIKSAKSLETISALIADDNPKKIPMQAKRVNELKAQYQKNALTILSTDDNQRVKATKTLAGSIMAFETSL